MEGCSAAAEPWGKLLEVQRELKVGKGQYNEYGGFPYRSKEDILEAAKPLCHERGLVLLCDDEERMQPNGWVYVACEARVVDAETGGCVSAWGIAREPEAKKGMDASQITGTASSYAGKRALGNLFALDDTADADAGCPQDAPVPQEPSGPVVGRCRSCGARYTFGSLAEMRAYAGCCPAPDYAAEA